MHVLTPQLLTCTKQSKSTCADLVRKRGVPLPGAAVHGADRLPHPQPREVHRRLLVRRPGPHLLAHVHCWNSRRHRGFPGTFPYRCLHDE